MLKIQQGLTIDMVGQILHTKKKKNGVTNTTRSWYVAHLEISRCHGN